MSQHLVLTIRLHDPRYHGAPEWPPAPARVFQALVAGAARGSTLRDESARALAWLERLPPPVIAAPRARLGSSVEMYVPNNDADAVGGDPGRIAEIRTRKLARPRLLADSTPLVYAWPLTGDTTLAAPMLEVAAELYQLGRGLDMAWATGELLDDDGLAELLSEHRGTLHRPAANDDTDPLPCPAPGSLDSLTRRHRANLAKLRVEGAGSAAHTLFSQPPKPRFVPVGYESLGQRWMYELRTPDDDTRRASWPLARVTSLIERVRDAAAARLRGALAEQHDAIERALIGRKADGSDDGPIAQRVRIMPLPSIGHEHADRDVRRILVEVPSDCPLRADDVRWAFTGLEPAGATAGANQPPLLVEAEPDGVFRQYEARRGARRWRSVTGVALPAAAARRRIEPSRHRDEAKPASERASEEARATRAVRAALRHAGVLPRAVAVAVQREPFAPRGARAEAFGNGTRFAKERLWHVDVELSEPVRGPLVIGDGRFLGLGVMAPVFELDGLFAFAVDGHAASAGDALVRAMRRAVMSRVQRELSDRPLAPFFTGHEPDGAPARTQHSSHIAVQWDPIRMRLLVLAPHLLDHRQPDRSEEDALRILGRGLEGFTELRAGRAGLCRLSRCAASETQIYLERSASWRTVRAYTVTRHPRRQSAADALTDDAITECARRGLPRPEVTVLAARGVRGRGLEGDLRLNFAVAVDGPLVLGRTRYLGGGLFLPDAGPGRSRDD